MSIFEISNFLGLAGYYRRFKNGLKLSIRGRIVGHRLRDRDCNTLKYTLVVFDMFRVFCKPNLNVS